MKERLAALEKIAQEKKQKEMAAIQAYQEKSKKGQAASAKTATFVGKAYDWVPPPPKDGKQIPKPASGSVKIYAISSGESPWMMNVIGIKAGPKPEMPAAVIEEA